MGLTFLLSASSLLAADRDRIEHSDFTRTVSIVFDGSSAAVTDNAGVTVTGADTASIVISSTVEGVEYLLSGQSADGHVQITSTHASKIILNGLHLASSTGPALSVFSSARNFIVLPEGTSNTLVDAATYTRTGSGALYSNGSLIFSGKGGLSVTGLRSHAIYARTYVRVLGGDITVPASARDAIHSVTFFQMDHGTLSLSPSGDGIDADTGSVVINGGSISILSTVDDTKGIAGDGPLTINGGSLHLTVSGTQSKAIKSESDIAINGGSLVFQMSGGVYLETLSSGYVDPSYCTAIKGDANLSIAGGEILITHSGLAGKGISIDGDIEITGGNIDITTTGAASSAYTGTDGARDMAAADCLKADGNLTITGGVIKTLSTGNGGDAISCDGAAIIGAIGVSGAPVISANTRGNRILLSGSGNNADYVNPKAFKAEGNITLNGGVFTATTTQPGGEGLESKATLTINGGLVEISAYDDAINASTHIAINGGLIYCYSSNNDGIDSNGTLRITGGTVIASGAGSPEAGFDCDNSNFTITGGIVIGTGGSTSTPTASTSTQRSVIYRGSGTSGVVLHVRSANGDSNLVYRLPRTYSGGGTAMTLLFSNSNLSAGTTYTILSGATVTGGEEFHGLHTGATVTGGTTLRTFTPSGMVTTVQ